MKRCFGVHVALLWSRILKQCAWNAFFHIFTTVQAFISLFTGTRWTIVNNRLPCNYQRSAQVCSGVH